MEDCIFMRKPTKRRHRTRVSFSVPKARARSHDERAPRSQLPARIEHARATIRASHGMLTYDDVRGELSRHFGNVRSMDGRLLKRLFEEEGYPKSREAVPKRIIAARENDPRSTAPDTTPALTQEQLGTSKSTAWKDVGAQLSALMRLDDIHEVVATKEEGRPIRIEVRKVSTRIIPM